MEKKRIDLQRQVTDLAGLKTLQDKLFQHGLTIEGMDNFITKNWRLLELGFTPDIASLFAFELIKYGLDNKNAAIILADDLSQSKSLRETINIRRTESNRLAEEIHTRKIENDGLKKQFETQQKQINDIRVIFKNEVKIYDEKKEQLQKEFKDINNKIKAANEEFENINIEIDKINKIRKALTEDLKNIEQIVEKNEYLKTATIMMSESTISLDWKIVRRVSLAFFNGFIKYLQANRHAFGATLVSNSMKIREILAEEVRYDFRPAV